MAHPRALTPAKEARVVEAYLKGKSSAELAEKHNVHRSTIVAAVTRAGHATRRPGGSKPKTAKGRR